MTKPYGRGITHERRGVPVLGAGGEGISEADGTTTIYEQSTELDRGF